MDRLNQDGVLEKVPYSDWAAPVVAVPKTDGGIRLCGDYKVTVNPVLDVDQYPLPKPDDIFAILSGGQLFTTRDLTHAYNQLLLDEDSYKFITVNTHKGCTSILASPLVSPLPLPYFNGQWIPSCRE